jgi:hypothetical protein
MYNVPDYFEEHHAGKNRHPEEECYECRQLAIQLRVFDAYKLAVDVLADAEVYDTRIPPSELRRALKGPFKGE